MVDQERSHSRHILLNASLVAGLIFTLSGCFPSTTTKAPTPVTAVSNEEITNYAKAVLAIETSRQAAATEIQRVAQSDKVPLVVCNQPSSLTNLTPDVQAIVVRYCNQAKRAGEGNGLTMTRFNAITVSLPSNSELATRVQTELAQLQQPTSPASPRPTPQSTPAT